MNQPKSHRGAEIIDLLTKAGGNLRIGSIAGALEVSEETIRRNVKTLAQEGLVQKTRGGVLLQRSLSELSFAQRMDENPLAKRKIAKCVANLIPDGASVFLDIGSTTAYIANALKNHQELMVVTNSVAVAYTLSARNKNRVFIPGGELRDHDGGIFGSEALEFIKQFNTDFAVLSTAAINAQNGFMVYDLEEAHYSKSIMDKAHTNIMAADSSKFGLTAPITLGDPSLVTTIVTDNLPPKDLQTASLNWEIDIMIAK